MTESPTAPPEVVYRWDLDKTYLATDFSTARGLLQAAVESAQRRKTIPGMRALLSALWHGHDARVVVVSGSPTFLRRRILTLFNLHGIRCDRLVLKDFGGAVRKGRFRSLSAQVPYKLRAHLDTRLWLAARHEDVGEICFGDDAEVDALVYCLYADVCARRVEPARLARILDLSGAYPDEIASILERVGQVAVHDPVRRIFIHLEGNSPPARFGAYRGRVTPTFNALQIALHLATENLADDRVLTAVAEELVSEHRVSAEGLAGSIEDALRRGLCSVELAHSAVVNLLPRTAAYDAGFTPQFATKVAGRLRHSVGEVAAVQPLQPLPYETLFEAEKAFAKARKLALQTAGKIPGLAEFLGDTER
ncbi:MAG: hypothetical protein EXR77_09380 [Myxococcales bacterium]|nr:hypothetical protein [Myxococcales bacterium]